MKSIVDTFVSILPGIRAGLAGRRTYAETENPTRDRQIQADVWVNEVLKEYFTSLEEVGAYASEEDPDVLECGTGYSVAVDPVDGSGNLTTNNVAGVIVGVYEGDLPCGGRQLTGSMYALFGPLITFSLAREDESGVCEYVVGTDGEGNGIRREPTVIDSLPEPELVSFGGRHHGWTDAFRSLAQSLGSTYRRRYSGAMIGDVSGLLHRGGLYAYPPTRDEPGGPSRILYEANPAAFLIEKAGGASSNGDRSILDVRPHHLHHRVPLFLGNRSLVEQVESLDMDV